MVTFIIIIFSTLIRLFPHIPNFVPISATALFGGTYFNKRFAVIIPLVTMMMSDYLLLYVNPYRFPLFDFSHVYSITAMFHATTLYVWGSFVISGLIGLWLRRRKKVAYIITASLFCSLQFYLITNFGVWASGMYSRGLDGLIQSYIMGLPFLKWTLFGDLFYTTVFFGIYECGANSIKRSLFYIF